MIVCVFEHVQWRFVLNDRLAPGPGKKGGLREGVVEARAAQLAEWLNLVVGLLGHGGAAAGAQQAGLDEGLLSFYLPHPRLYG
jgi:hypothetical protein